MMFLHLAIAEAFGVFFALLYLQRMVSHAGFSLQSARSVFVCVDSVLIAKYLNSDHGIAIWQPIVSACRALNRHIYASLV